LILGEEAEQNSNPLSWSPLGKNESSTLGDRNQLSTSKQGGKKEANENRRRIDE